uniref:Fatty acid desaturase domain-containing protein n=1 Tax=Parascaris univalens TaxID=6257 RepID=A0A915BNT3_PARUN
MDVADEGTLMTAADQYLAPDFKEITEINEQSKKEKFVASIVWRNVVLFALLHVFALFGAYQIIFVAKWPTVLWTVVCWLLSVLGITAGAHRLWSHRSYKATWPARLFLMLCNCVAFQNDVIEWSRDHRCHHKWTDTDADPHNTKRGFFFSHMGWLLVRKHPQLKQKGAQIYMGDLYEDSILMFQRRYYKCLVVLFCFLIPTAVPVYFWREATLTAFLTAAVFRYCFILHETWLINSAAHKYGFKPYDINITPTESFWLAVVAAGEGGHNYHHVFPQDYRTSEYSFVHNITKVIIDAMAAVGLVYDLKVVPQHVIERQKARQLNSTKSA